MTKLKYKSKSRSVEVTCEEHADRESVFAWFGLCMLQHHKFDGGQSTSFCTPSDSGWTFDGITIHEVNGGAVLNFANGDEHISINLTGITPESLCDAVEAARLQEITQ